MNLYIQWFRYQLGRSQPFGQHKFDKRFMVETFGVGELKRGKDSNGINSSEKFIVMSSGRHHMRCNAWDLDTGKIIKVDYPTVDSRPAWLDDPLQRSLKAAQCISESNKAVGSTAEFVFP